MTKYIVSAARTEYAEIELEAEDDAALVELLNEYDEYDFNWYGGDWDYDYRAVQK